ncbi:hypothetical protein CFOL_v3_29342 [Cephalotus follicularis]|uniref:Transposase (putative) gypsy type domain-containing protein n=1 Tax=Cephalotus follicularis TaxID=3775 RepID=A0A1Q3D0S7_CEPFO|nr:hypothetical protein CFOL_v3_29342 [Cephalotus follicularis]
MSVKKLEELVREYSIPGSLDLEIPSDPRMASESRQGYFVVFQEALVHGLRLPLPPFAISILRHYQVHPLMLQAQSWGFIIGFLVRCLEAGVTAIVGLFKEFHTITSSPKNRGFYFKSQAGHHRLLSENTRRVKNWREKYFMVKNLPGFTPSPWTDTLDTVALSQKVFLSREERVDLDKLLALTPEEVLVVVSEINLQKHGLSRTYNRRVGPDLAGEVPKGIRIGGTLGARDGPNSLAVGDKRGRRMGALDGPESTVTGQGESCIMLSLENLLFYCYYSFSDIFLTIVPYFYAVMANRQSTLDAVRSARE